MASEENIEDVPSAKKAKLSSPTPASTSSWTPSVPVPEHEAESCDSGLSESGVTTPGVQEELEVGEGEGEPSTSNDLHMPDVEDDDSLSGLSDMSGHDWKPDMSSKLNWLHAAMRRGENPKDILETLLPSGSEIPDSLDNMTMWKVLFNLLSEPPRRSKLENVNTLENCVQLIRESKNIIILTGAGVSVSCGIPDFRSRDGVYARLAVDFPDLPDPQAMFDIHYFKKDPRPFFKFAREIYPGQFQPSPCHKFIRCVETSGKLLRNYTQNIDTLEQVAGIENVIQCHGSFATASCMVCKRRVNAEAIRGDIFNQTIPKCGICPEPEQSTEPEESSPMSLDISDILGIPAPVQLPVMKPDIVFFGEGLPDHFHNCISQDKGVCDLLIVIGSSLKVRPVALIPSSLPEEVPQILINREPLPHLTFDVELLGDCDRIINQLCLMLETENWTGPIHQERLLQHDGMPPTDESKQEMEKQTRVLPQEESKSEDSKAISRELKEDEVSQSVTSYEKEKSEQNEEEPQNKDGDDGDDEDFKIKSLSDYIPSGHFLFLPPSRYVFPGAELYPEQDSSDDEDDAENIDENEENVTSDNIDNSERSEHEEHEVVTDTTENVHNQIFTKGNAQESHQI